jgi:hypothetical protein
MKRAHAPIVLYALVLGAALHPGAEASAAFVTTPSVLAEEGGRSVMPEVLVPGEASLPPPLATIAEPAPVKTLEDDPPSAERTPRPTALEWKGAPAVALSRQPRNCRAQRAREWLRITCRVRTLAAMDLLAGEREGVAFDFHDTGEEQGVTLPLRRGDRRVLQIVEVASWSKYTVDYDAAFSITEDWLDGAAAPTVVVD